MRQITSVVKLTVPTIGNCATDQITALGLMGIDPVGKAVAPRFWAAVLSMPLLTAFFCSLAIAASWFQAVQVLGMAPEAVVVKATLRMRCPACSTHLFSEIESAGLCSVNAFFLPEGAFTAQMHIQCQHAIFPVVDNLPHYKGFPPEFGGMDERADW